MSRYTFVLGIVVVPLVVASTVQGQTELPLLLAEDFQAGADRWETTDLKQKSWTIIDTDIGKAFRVTGKSDYEPPHRSPHSIALVKDIVVGDFVLTARVKSTNSSAGDHRDMCLFFGYQDPAHFYYVHLATKADPHAGQIFIVNENPRTKITLEGKTSTPWDDQWHDVKIVRRVSDGTMEVYFDDMGHPHLVARDRTFRWGQVGIGTFDDHGNWGPIELRGVKAERPEGRTNR
jgi:hypothetical protein